jgi:electron transfer flavoprotein alpha subunit
MSNDILVFGEMREGELKKIIKELITGARIISEAGGSKIEAIIVGKGAGEAAEGIRNLGLSKITAVEGEGLSNYSTEGYATVLSDYIKSMEPAYVLLGATSMGRDLAPRTAARVDGVMFSDCVDLKMEDSRVVVKRPVYSGKLFVEIAPKTEPVFITIRPNNLPPAGDEGDGTEVTRITSDISEDLIRAIATEIVPLEGGRPDITEADVIVSGGRAMKDKSNFSILGELTDLLGGAVGASRAAVDAGYAPQDIQVGQTGKIVNPKLYVACGISGAIQHLAGMRTSKVIVAVNKDPNAPIFEKADYGIVGDLFDVVPLMTKEIKAIL